MGAERAHLHSAEKIRCVAPAPKTDPTNCPHTLRAGLARRAEPASIHLCNLEHTWSRRISRSTRSSGVRLAVLIVVCLALLHCEWLKTVSECAHIKYSHMHGLSHIHTDASTRQISAAKSFLGTLASNPRTLRRHPSPHLRTTAVGPGCRLQKTHTNICSVHLH
jgi:hypothetical protein